MSSVIDRNDKCTPHIMSNVRLFTNSQTFTSYKSINSRQGTVRTFSIGKSFVSYKLKMFEVNILLALDILLSTQVLKALRVLTSRGRKWVTARLSLLQLSSCRAGCTHYKRLYIAASRRLLYLRRIHRNIGIVIEHVVVWNSTSKIPQTAMPMLSGREQLCDSERGN